MSTPPRLLLTLLLAVAAIAEAGPTDRDPTFGTTGTTLVPFGLTDQAEAVVTLPDGRIVAVGSTPDGFAVARLTAAGALDPTFSGDGRLVVPVGPNARAFGLARQADGQIIVAGVVDVGAGAGATPDFALVRIDATGAVDLTFGTQGLVTVSFSAADVAHAVAVQPDGRIVVAGESGTAIAVARLTATGTLDPTFNASAAATPASGPGRQRLVLPGSASTRDLHVAADGSITLAGSVLESVTRDVLVVRLTAAGIPDAAFGRDGVVTVPAGANVEVSALAVLPDGRIVVGATHFDTSPDLLVVRVLPDGTLDQAFNPIGTPTESHGNGRSRLDLGGVEALHGLAIQADGRIVLVGTTTVGTGPAMNLAVARLTADGAADTTFAPGGGLGVDLGDDDRAFGVALAADGGILVAGRRGTAFMVTRLEGGPTPGIYITTPTVAPTFTAQAPFLSLRGTAGDDVAVAAVSWRVSNPSGTDVTGTAIGTSAWQAEVPLRGGMNTVTVTAIDAQGHTSTDTLTVTVGEFVYYLSEGATGPFFDLDILIANPTASDAFVKLSYLLPDGALYSRDLTIAPLSRTTIKVDQDDEVALSNTAVSAVVRSTNAVPLVVERTMFWDGAYYGGHTGTAVEAPRTRWLFGEGSQGFFDTYVLLANATDTAATATVTFLVEGGPNVVEVVPVPPTSRQNVYAGAIPALVGKSFSIVVTATVPIIAERAMYFGQRLFEGGHESAGVADAATSWFHAEGATGPFFETFILVGNPNPVPANLTVTFLKGDGTSLVRQKQVPANGRFTLWVDAEDPLLADAEVSTAVVSDVPVVSERAMYWAGPSSSWYEAHNSFGVTALAQKWALAEGRVGQAPGFSTFVLLANPSTQQADVRVTYLRASGAPIVRSYTVAPTSRFNIWVNDAVPELRDEDFGVLLEVQNGVGIAVERALYWSSGGVGFAGGTNATGVRVP